MIPIIFEIFWDIFLSIIFIFILPGFIILQSVKSKFTIFDQILLSIPFSITIISVFGVFISKIGLKFNINNYLIFVLLLLIIYLILSKKIFNFYLFFSKFKILFINKNNIIERFLLIIPSLVIFSILVTGFSGFITPPHIDDVSNHNLMMHQIYKSETAFFPNLFTDWDGQITASWYPIGFHAMTALVRYLIPIPIYILSFYLIMALASLFPLSTYFFTKTFTNTKDLPLFVAYTSITLWLFPYALFYWGGWAKIVGMVLLPFALSFFYIALCERNIIFSILSGLLLSGIFYIHTTELITMAIFLVILIPFLMKSKNQSPKLIFKNAFVIGLIFSFLCIPAIPIIISPAGHAVGGAVYGQTTFEEFGISPLLKRIAGYVFYGNHNYLMLAFLMIGVLYSLYYKKYLHFISASGMFWLIFLGSKYNLIPALTISPWSEPTRIAYIQCYFITFFSGLGLLLTWSWLSNKIPPEKFKIWFKFIFLLMSIIMSYNSIIISQNHLHNMVEDYSPTTIDDLKVMEWIRDNTPEDSVILNDLHYDSGLWIPIIADRQISQPLMKSVIKDWENRSYLRCHLCEVEKNERIPKLMDEYHIKYVFYGSKTVRGEKREHTLNLSELKNNEHFKLVYRSGSAYLFEYVR